MAEAIIEKKEEKIPESLEEIELEVFSALESLVKKEIPENSQKTNFANLELIKPPENIIENDESRDLFSSEYSKPKDAQQILDYKYSSDEPRSFYDSENQQETEIKEEILQEIKSKKIANTFNINTPAEGDPSLAKKSAQELYKTINFTMNTILYDLVEV